MDNPVIYLALATETFKLFKSSVAFFLGPQLFYISPE